MKQFLLDIIKQLIGWNSPRTGRLVFTRNAYTKMRDYQLTEATIFDTFKYGEEIAKGDKRQVTRKYQNYSVGLWYKAIYTPFHHNIPSEKKYLVITCWKQ